MNAKRSINAVEITMQHIRKNLMLKKTKIKIMNDFIANKKTMNAKTFKKDENNVQSILYCRVISEFFKNDY